MNSSIVRWWLAILVTILLLGGTAAVLLRIRSEMNPPLAKINRSARTPSRLASLKIQVGDPLPDFEVPGLDGGSFSSLKDWDPSTEILVINFHSPDCPCAVNCAALVNEMQQAGAEGLRIIGILSGPGQDEYYRARARDQVREGVVTFPLYLDPDQTVRRIFGAERTPTVWVFATDGQAAFVGAPESTLFPDVEGHRFLLREAVEALRNGVMPEVQAYEPLGCPFES